MRFFWGNGGDKPETDSEMMAPTDSQADRHTHTYTQIIPCVILSLRVRVRSKGTRASRIFTPASPCMCSLAACTHDHHSPVGVLSWIVCVYQSAFGISFVCTFVLLRDRWTDRTREQHRLGFCPWVCLRVSMYCTCVHARVYCKNYGLSAAG